MKKLAVFLCSLALAFSLVGVAVATPITFDVAGASGGSSVTVIDFARWGDLSASLSPNLGDQNFILVDGETRAIDFFTLTASGAAWDKDYIINATLAFDRPNIVATGSGGGSFSTFFGLLSGGTLSWDSATLPDTFSVNGNLISVNFEGGATVGFGSTTTVSAFIRNQGGGATAAPVPEPSTILLMGAGLLGLVAVGRRKFNRKE